MTSQGRHGMFLLQGDHLVALDETPYDSESLLQRFLAQHPDLLAGHQIDPVTPRRWLLVDREVAIPDSLEATGRWSLDHLFIDQDGIPTLVEVKRSTDTRIRREVVGQILEYAANALAYLPVDRIRAVFEAQCEAAGRQPDSVLAEFLIEEGDPDAFWAQVDENVRARRLRLVFVADVIPPELARIVEYLNEQMRTTEVFAVELKQYQGGELRTLVPRVIGRTATAEATKQRAAAGSQWTWERFAEALASSSGPDAVVKARRIYDWAVSRTEPWWGRGAQQGGFVAIFEDSTGVRHQLFEVWTSGHWEVYFQHLAAKGPFTDRLLREELWRRLNAIEGVSLGEGVLERRPTFRFASLGDTEIEAALAVFDSVIASISSAHSPQ
jgi:hypothetical protein